jgi:hypothetical protein
MGRDPVLLHTYSLPHRAVGAEVRGALAAGFAGGDGDLRGGDVSRVRDS